MPRIKNASFSWVAAAVAAIFIALASPVPASAADIAFPTIGSPSFSGISQVGATLTATTGSWSPTPTSFTYQWKRDGMDINFATNSTYLVTGDDYLRNISVTVAASRVGYITTPRTTGTMYISLKGDLQNVPNLTVNGTMMVGETLYAVTSGFPSNTNISFQWQQNLANISSAISDSYQIQPTDKYRTIGLRVTLTRYGYNDLIKTFNATETVQPATPKLLWQYNYGIFTGKNTVKANATHSFGSNDGIKTWCIKKDGVGLDLPLSTTKGIYFTDASNMVLNVYKSGVGCYSSNTGDLLNMGMRVDVTDWGVGSHNLEATVQDVMASVSKPFVMPITVGKTAPTVSGNFSSLTDVIKGDFTVSATTTTHSTEAPVTRWCLTVDGGTVDGFSAATFTSMAGQVQDRSSLVQSNGCVFSNNSTVVLTQGQVSINSMQFSNGAHDLGIRVMSQDSEGTVWWSDVAKATIKIKNPYIPKVAWSSAVAKTVTKGSASKVSGVISANIPGNPSKVTLSAKSASGDWNVFFSNTGSNTFSGSAKFSKNTNVQIEIFDEDNASVLTDEIEVKVAPVVKLAKPKVVLTGSTISDAITKTVTVSAASAGLDASCSAKWSGGSRKFAMSGGKGSITFRPRGSGTVSVTCSASDMAPSAPVSAKY